MASFTNFLFRPTYHLSIAHYFLIFFLASSYPHTSKLHFGDALPSSKPCIDEERRALLAFKQDLIDPSGGFLLGLVKLAVNGKAFHAKRSQINPSLLSLKHLSYLDLSRNDFQGIPIPTFFGQFKSLRYLNISHASFGGEIPAHLGNLSNLNYLDLSEESGYSLLELPSNNLKWLSNLSSLKYLSLEGVDLINTGLKSQLPTSVGMLHNLKYLNLYNNDMSGSIPKSLGQLSELVHLDLSFNPWEGFLTEAHFTNLTRLKYFSIGKDTPYPTLPIPLIFNVSYEWVPPFKLHKINIGNCKVGPAFGAWLQSQTELVFVKLSTTGISDSIPEDWFMIIIFPS
ncbi:leucine-rich repeat receptor protein kinase MSP1 [Prunus yedoensis var. nudiflora]|uniref:Leucine-rich repeat receptor protein kinase MSP1 n=1 Tax=Prunus yedoensis var. nudiflora TaxID=2094558 RepID=A0A314Z6U5_PRUYE|nr:leucine-rich repeat receptor protein kinase MSP1 [Prunus yedoensis var. nudiflora]